MSKRGNKITKIQKRIVYIIMVMILLGVFAVLVYLIFILINFNGELIKMDDKTAVLTGSVLAILSAMFGVLVGKKWWGIVYEERGGGAFLKMKK